MKGLIFLSWNEASGYTYNRLLLGAESEHWGKGLGGGVLGDLWVRQQNVSAHLIHDG